jgi:GDPmannose 4,6-dehydratase
VTRAVAAICSGKQDKLYLGNLAAMRDWGYAPEYVEAMWMMLQRDEPDDYVLATGVGKSVENLCETAFGLVGLDWREHVSIDERYLRPFEVNDLRGNCTKARERLNWSPQVSFDGLVQIMLQADLTDHGLKPEEWLRVPVIADQPDWARRP